MGTTSIGFSRHVTPSHDVTVSENRETKPFQQLAVFVTQDTDMMVDVDHHTDSNHEDTKAGLGQEASRTRSESSLTA
jgi:hypothetical protein